VEAMRLAVLYGGQVFEVDLESDLREYDLTRNMARASLCADIANAMKVAEREVGR